MLKIEWQRLVIDDETCPRCGSTEEELDRAVSILKSEGYSIELSKKQISKAEFDAAPLESNRVLINGKTIEELLSAKTGSSCCCDACGDADCRTVEYNSKTYETIPADLIIEAVRKAI